MSQDIREEMRRLPRVLQPFLTWVTGKAYQGQRPLFNGNAFTQTASAMICLYAPMILGAYALSRGGIVLLYVPLGWLFIAGAARKIQVTLLHQCAHFNFFGNRTADRLAGQILSTLVFVDHFDSYYREHILLHHTKTLATELDPDCKFLLELGFSPGLSKHALWQRLWKTIFSPYFHFVFLRARFRANFISATLPRKVMAFVYQGVIFATAIANDWLPAYLVMYILPLTICYHIAALLNFSSLHVWLKPAEAGEGFKERMCSLTNGRFLGEPPPDINLPVTQRVFAWSIWTLRMVFLHLPARIGVLSGDLPVHDYHHRYPRCKRWANYLYMRQHDIDRGLGPWKKPYTEVWGLNNCLDVVFESLSLTPEVSHSSEILDTRMIVQI